MTKSNKSLSAGHINLKQKPECFRDPLRLYHQGIITLFWYNE